MNTPDEPDIALAGLSIWALARQFPDANDFWDGNWINIKASIRAPGAYVEIAGPWLRSDEIATFRQALSKMNETLTGTAALACVEPMLRATVACGSLGQIEAIVDITPDHLTQSHRFTFAIDQSYLGGILAGCARVLEKFPVKGEPSA